ncbi:MULTISPECIES: hypothetical protein [Pseudoalteromonas]|uniref:hypothetical protein n=1 Tax=Pseudoalteromonas TaxID=53246 RepID=UPI00057EB3AE|nr:MULTISPECIES: hypothetical protein [Pseudoalteromonas]KID38534.1 hypothetical protein QT15_03425 [Pseudoalteromonas flavipulchra NCIMB 2033 = ATCC BAA-314]MBD0783220.1 hypothetical protein [Pseudoalteromonas flavipulchra]MBE0371888.1 hypothetical protein [Pseudoalteromonas flavipulchra NCIMB 2033 = ATCC BAA-314]MCG9770528.1 hypothetical protein [Pseudoalteromonas piscicida]QZO13724.1 hypothetical protein K5642_04195 [Pseudoalteromonas piscicida]
MNNSTNTVYVLSGYAKCAITQQGKYKPGNKHSIGLLTTDENYEDNINKLEAFIKDLGWESITFCMVETVNDISTLSNDVLVSSFLRAQQNGQSLVVNDLPITVH